tara:strand:+ start:4448 stop:4639 length:192 start_codon:yes stop_codon:yes gene_type:complete
VETKKLKKDMSRTGEVFLTKHFFIKDEAKMAICDGVFSSTLDISQGEDRNLKLITYSSSLLIV